ncbi:hypothetical protein IJJ18_02865 [Candidatus Saccharibacteria bacterium]|nr:hypothetical protein [Candidatus Saccharibacteria bacterium]
MFQFLQESIIILRSAIWDREDTLQSGARLYKEDCATRYQNCRLQGYSEAYMKTTDISDWTPDELEEERICLIQVNADLLEEVDRIALKHMKISLWMMLSEILTGICLVTTIFAVFALGAWPPIIASTIVVWLTGVIPYGIAYLVFSVKLSSYFWSYGWNEAMIQLVDYRGIMDIQVGKPLF